jgi:hypothetical protein
MQSLEWRVSSREYSWPQQTCVGLLLPEKGRRLEASLLGSLVILHNFLALNYS